MVNEITKLKQALEHERNLNNNLRNALLGQDNADDVLKQAHTFKKQAESLQEENRKLREELDFIKRGRTTTQAINKRVDKSNAYTVSIICMMIQGKKMEDICNTLSINQSTYYRAVSAEAISDSQHMKDLYTYYKGIFDEHNITEETFKDWGMKRKKYLGRG